MVKIGFNEDIEILGLVETSNNWRQVQTVINSSRSDAVRIVCPTEIVCGELITGPHGQK
jgi:hypothetical protein